MSPPSVLVIVPTLGTRRCWLKQCLTSIASSFIDLTIRVVCPSNAVGTVLSLHPSIDISSLDRPGLAAAINHGWRDYDQYDYATWLGDDDLLAPHALDFLTSVLDRDTVAVVAYGRTRYIDAYGNTLWIARPSRLAPKTLAHGADWIPQPGSLYRRSALESIGPLDESLSNAMDLDMFLRLRPLGRFVYIHRELSAYRLHGTSITMSKGANDESWTVRNRYIHDPETCHVRVMRKTIRIGDRLVGGIQRRMPVTPAAISGGQPYISHPFHYGCDIG